MPLCSTCGMWFSDGAAFCSSCGTPASEAAQPPPPPPPPPPPLPPRHSLPFGAKVLISGVVVAAAAGGTWLGLSPDSPLRDDPPAMTITPYSGPTSPNAGSVVEGGVTVTAHIGDEDSMWWIEPPTGSNDLEAAYVERGLPVPPDVLDPPVHASRPFVVHADVSPLPAEALDGSVSVTVRGGEPCEVHHLPGAGWVAACFAPAAPGTAVVEVATGAAMLELVLEVLEPAGISVTVEQPPVTRPGAEVLLTGTITNSSRVAMPVGGGSFVVTGYPDCDPGESWPEPGQWHLLLEGETREWSCTVTAPDVEGSYTHTVEITTDDPSAYPGAVPAEFTLEVGTPPIIAALERWWLGEYGEPGEAHQAPSPADSPEYWALHLGPGPLPQEVYSIGNPGFPFLVGVYADAEAAQAAFDGAADAAAAEVRDDSGAGVHWCEWGYQRLDRIQFHGHDAYVLSLTLKAVDVPFGFGAPEAEGGWCTLTEPEVAQYYGPGIATVVEVTTFGIKWVQGRSLVWVHGVSADGSHYSDNWGGYYGMDPGAHERLFAELDPVLPG